LTLTLHAPTHTLQLNAQLRRPKIAPGKGGQERDRGAVIVLMRHDYSRQSSEDMFAASN